MGIKLMPRMRGLGDVTFYRPAKGTRYEHIDALFTGEIDWDLIATHARDMIQVVLSIQAGRVMPSMLLRKLGTYNRRSLLYRAFRELGRVERTLFLLRFFSNIEVRQVIRAETTKIEAYNDLRAGSSRPGRQWPERHRSWRWTGSRGRSTGCWRWRGRSASTWPSCLSWRWSRRSPPR